MPRGLNSAKRCASINIGLWIASFIAMKAGLKRSTCPTCPLTLFFLIKFKIFSASSMVFAIGFSIKICFFCRIAFSAHS